MSSKIILVLALAGVCAACAPRQPEPVVSVAPAAVTVEPVYSGKF